MLPSARADGKPSGVTYSKDAAKLGTCECPVEPCKSGTCMATAIGDNLSIVVVTVVEVGADDASVEVMLEKKSVWTCYE